MRNQYASWGQRAGALLIDTAILAGAVMVAVFLLAILSTALFAASTEAGVAGLGVLVLVYLVTPILSIAFLAWQLCRAGERNGQTFGKQLVGIRVVRCDGRPVTVGTVLMRQLLPGILFTFTLGIATILDLLWPLWDERRQALHDKIASTVVLVADTQHATFTPETSPATPRATSTEPRERRQPSPADVGIGVGVLCATLLYLVASLLDWQHVTGIFGSINFGRSEWNGIGIVAGMAAIAVAGWEAVRLTATALDPVARRIVSAALPAALLLLTIITFLSHDEARWWPAWIGLLTAFLIAGLAGARLAIESATPSGGLPARHTEAPLHQPPSRDQAQTHAPLASEAPTRVLLPQSQPMADQPIPTPVVQRVPRAAPAATYAPRGETAASAQRAGRSSSGPWILVAGLAVALAIAGVGLAVVLTGENGATSATAGTTIAAAPTTETTTLDGGAAEPSASAGTTTDAGQGRTPSGLPVEAFDAGEYARFASMRSRSNAERLASTLQGLGTAARVLRSDLAAELLPDFYVVVAGPIASATELRRLLRSARRAGITDAFSDSLSPATTTIDPTTLTGTWSGRASRIAADDDIGNRKLSVDIAIGSGGTTGSISYPDVSCTGTLSLIESTDVTASYRETISGGSCPTGGVWHLKWVKDRLGVTWRATNAATFIVGYVARD